MKTMYFEHALRYLAGALSYCKQVISGHTKGADLDHRIDVLGQLKVVQDYLEQIDPGLYIKISSFIRKMQAKNMNVEQEDLQFIRQLYLDIQAKQNEKGKDTVETNIGEDVPLVDIVFLEVSHKQYFDFVYRSIKNYAGGYGKIYAISPGIDMSQYKDVQIVNVPLKEFAKDAKLSDDFLVWYEYCALLRPYDLRRVGLSYSIKGMDINTIKEFVGLGIKKRIMNYERMAPQRLNKSKFQTIDYSGNHVVTAYICMLNQTPIYETATVARVDKVITGFSKELLALKEFVVWNDNTFNHVKRHFEMKK